MHITTIGAIISEYMKRADYTYSPKHAIPAASNSSSHKFKFEVNFDKSIHRSAGYDYDVTFRGSYASFEG